MKIITHITALFLVLIVNQTSVFAGDTSQPKQLGKNADRGGIHSLGRFFTGKDPAPVPSPTVDVVASRNITFSGESTSGVCHPVCRTTRETIQVEDLKYITYEHTLKKIEIGDPEPVITRETVKVQDEQHITYDHVLKTITHGDPNPKITRETVVVNNEHHIDFVKGETLVFEGEKPEVSHTYETVVLQPTHTKRYVAADPYVIEEYQSPYTNCSFEVTVGYAPVASAGCASSSSWSSCASNQRKSSSMKVTVGYAPVASAGCMNGRYSACSKRH